MSEPLKRTIVATVEIPREEVERLLRERAGAPEAASVNIKCEMSQGWDEETGYQFVAAHVSWCEVQR